MLDYRFCKFHDGKEALLCFYQVRPASGKLERVRIKLNHISGNDRARYARNLKKKIDDLLEGGQWNYWTHGIEEYKGHLIGDMIDRYLASKGARIREVSLKSYQSRLGILHRYLIEHRPNVKYIQEVTPEIAAGLMDHLLIVRKYKAKTHNLALVDYSTFFKWLVDRDYLNRNPFSKIEKMREDEERMELFSGDQVAHLFAYMAQNHPHFYVVCGLIFYCLVRRAEITKLKIGDIDFRAGVLRIPASISKNHAVRNVIIPTEFMEALHALSYPSYPPQCFIVGENFRPGPKKIKQVNYISKLYRSVADKIGFPKQLRLYSLKHTGVSQMSASGFSVAAIRDQAGWKRAEQIDAYLRPTTEALEKLRTFRK